MCHMQVHHNKLYHKIWKKVGTSLSYVFIVFHIKKKSNWCNILNVLTWKKYLDMIYIARILDMYYYKMNQILYYIYWIILYYFSKNNTNFFGVKEWSFFYSDIGELLNCAEWLECDNSPEDEWFWGAWGNACYGNRNWEVNLSL